MRSYGRTFILRGPHGGVISTHIAQPDIMDEKRAAELAHKEAKKAKERWEASDQFPGQRLTIEEIDE